MPRIQLHGELHEIEDCPICGVTVFMTVDARLGFLAECGRRLPNLLECRKGSCTRYVDSLMQALAKKHAFSDKDSQ